MATLAALFDTLHVRLDLATPAEIVEACRVIMQAQGLSGGERATLQVLYQGGPLWDDYLPSMLGRDGLLELGLAVRTMVLGQDGYIACTTRGAQAWRLLQAESCLIAKE